MRDRNLIVLGLVFLVLTIGFGVNKSLEAGNKMVGVPMAPGAVEIYKLQAPAAREKAEQIAYQAGRRAKSLYDFYYPQTRKYTETIKTGFHRDAKRIVLTFNKKMAVWGAKVKQGVSLVGEKLKNARYKTPEKI